MHKLSIWLRIDTRDRRSRATQSCSTATAASFSLIAPLNQTNGVIFFAFLNVFYLLKTVLLYSCNWKKKNCAATGANYRNMLGLILKRLHILKAKYVLNLRRVTPARLLRR